MKIIVTDTRARRLYYRNVYKITAYFNTISEKGICELYIRDEKKAINILKFYSEYMDLLEEN